ncbi:YheU family protein [Desulfocicer niacini]
MNAVKIPHDQLSPEALQGVIEEFLTRDGTDYGEVEVPLKTRLAQALGHLKSGKVVIVFDPDSQTCTLISKDDPRLKLLDTDAPSVGD